MFHLTLPHVWMQGHGREEDPSGSNQREGREYSGGHAAQLCGKGLGPTGSFTAGWASGAAGVRPPIMGRGNSDRLFVGQQYGHKEITQERCVLLHCIRRYESVNS